MEIMVRKIEKNTTIIIIIATTTQQTKQKQTKFFSTKSLNREVYYGGQFRGICSVCCC